MPTSLPQYRMSEMPDCPVCGVVPEASWRQTQMVAGVSYPSFGVSHPCECAYGETTAPEYHKGIERVRAGFAHRAAFLSSLPHNYAEAAKRGYVGDEAYPLGDSSLDAYLELEEVRSGVIYLWGEAGGGKTTLAAHLALGHIQRTGTPALFLNDVATKSYMFRTFGDKTLPPLEYAQYGCVVFDDLGKSQPTPHYSEFIYGLVEHCTSHGKLLIVPTNYAPQALEPRLGFEAKTLEALMSRLTSGIVRHWGEPDHRKQVASWAEQRLTGLPATPVAQGGF